MQEYEVKILEIDVEKTLKILADIGATKTMDTNLVAEFFKDNTWNKLRLRQVDNVNKITYKKVIEKSWIMHNEELEISFDDYEQMKSLFISIGFEQYWASQKRRISYTWNNIHFDIDTYPGIPTYVEVESDNEDDVKKGVEILGYSMDQTCNLTERTLKEHYGIT
jgi:adenylate cyclase class 2